MKREYEGEGTMSCTHLESASSQSSLQASVQLGVVVTCSYMYPRCMVNKSLTQFTNGPNIKSSGAYIWAFKEMKQYRLTELPELVNSLEQ